MAPERSDGGEPPVIPRDVGHRFREDSEKWPTSGRNQWPRSVGMGGRLASESVAGLGRNTQLAIEGKLQASASGSMIRHTYFVHAFAMSPVADWLATMRAGTSLRILGSLDYLYRADAPTVAERVVLSIRIEELALHA